MKRLMLIITLQLFFVVAFSQYTTPGTGVNWTMNDLVTNSNGVVTGTSGNYTINSDLTIAQNDTLTFINDGEYEILCNQGVLITVKGTMLALLDNAEVNSVTFLGGENNFKGFTFTGSNGSVLKNININKAGGVKLIESDVYFRNCKFEVFNMENCTGAVDIYKSNPVLSLCSFSHNEGPAIKSAANAESAPIIDSCLIMHNVMGNINMPQINLGTTPVDDTIRITNSMVVAPATDQAGGIAVSTLAGGTLNAIIENTIISEGRYGIAVFGNNIFTIIKNNQVEFNIDADPMQGGSGITFWGDDSNISIISGNKIHNNLWGVTILNNAKPDLGDTENTLSPGENEIYNNGNNGQVYDVYNNTAQNIKAENNYWGTNNADTIEAHIYHNFDDPSLGVVDYIPFIISEEIPENLTSEKSKINVYPVPANKILHIELTEKTCGKIQVYNTQGVIVKNFKQNNKNVNLDVSSWNNGVYYIILKQNNITEGIRKIVIQH